MKEKLINMADSLKRMFTWMSVNIDK
jgi:hypothetical protein